MNVGNVTIALWIALAAGGVAVTAWNLRDAWLDLRSLDTPGNGRRLIARVNVANEAALLVASALLLVAGTLVAAVQFNPAPPPASLYVRGVIIFAILVLSANSVASRWRRHRLEDILQAEADQSGPPA